MKLDQALKLYIGLYCLCFIFSWFVSVPMIMHVSQDGECLLFVSPYIQYGPAAGCWITGFGFIAVSIAALIMFVLHVMQLSALKKYLRQPGPHSSKDYHSRPTRVFWPMVVGHGITTFGVLAITAIITSGYASSCQNLYREVSKKVNSRIDIPSNQINAAYDQYSDSRSIDRYTNPEYQNPSVYGGRTTDQYITCRKIFTDWENTRLLKEHAGTDPRNRRYWGNSGGFHDYGNIRYYTWRNNMFLELALAGSWISFVAWTIVFILMITLRQHLKAHLTDESMWGSQYGGKSRRGGSRMSEHSFDVRSNISHQSGSRYSASRGGGGHPPRGRQSLPPDNMSYQGSLQDGPPRSKYLSPNYKATPSQISSNGSAHKGQPPHRGRSREKNTPDKSNPDSSLLKYFAEHPPVEEEVDIDFALNEHVLDERDGHRASANHYPEQDTSFGSEGLPAGLDNTMNGLGDPIPLGDEVSEGHLSAARDYPNIDPSDFQCNTIHGHHSQDGTPDQCPSPRENRYPSGATPANPNRVTGTGYNFCYN